MTINLCKSKSWVVPNSYLEHHTLISVNTQWWKDGYINWGCHNLSDRRDAVCISHSAVFNPACCKGCLYLRIRMRGASRWRGEDCADFPDKPAAPRLDIANRWPGSPGFLPPCCSPCARSPPGSSYLDRSDGPVAHLLQPHAPASSSAAAAATLITHGFAVWRQQLLLHLKRH